MLGLPARVRACLFDLDGVLPSAAQVPDAAWQEMHGLACRAGVVGTDLAELPDRPE
jgi:hypothetical protein